MRLHYCYCVSGHSSRLEGIFLESPRIAPSTADAVFLKCFPELQVLSLCRYPEVTVDNVVTACGLDKPSPRSVRYIRLCDCERIGPRDDRRLRGMLNGVHLVVN
jgi:hypothetical protein